MYPVCAEAFVCSASNGKLMYIDCIVLYQLLSCVKDAWYSAHLNHLISQRVAFFYIIYFLKKYINKNYQQNDAGFKLPSKDGASS